MLILARHEAEEIHLHTSEELVRIKVTSVSPQSGLVRLGIDAPDSIDIVRAEIDILDPVPINL